MECGKSTNLLMGPRNEDRVYACIFRLFGFCCGHDAPTPDVHPAENQYPHGGHHPSLNRWKLFPGQDDPTPSPENKQRSLDAIAPPRIQYHIRNPKQHLPPRQTARCNSHPQRRLAPTQCQSLRRDSPIRRSSAHRRWIASVIGQTHCGACGLAEPQLTLSLRTPSHACVTMAGLSAIIIIMILYMASAVPGNQRAARLTRLDGKRPDALTLIP